MNAIDMLKVDHTRVRRLFREYDSGGAGAAQPKAHIAEQIFTELEVHSTIEEEIFYPAVQAKADEEVQDLVADSIEDHQAVKELIAELQGLDPNDERYAAMFEDLREIVEEHVGEEEDEMFADAEETLAAELERLGTQMERRKEELMASKS